MNVEFLEKVIDELNVCNAAFEAILQEEVAILQGGLADDECLLKDIEAKSEKCRKKIASLKDVIFKMLMESGCTPDDYLQRRVREYFIDNDSYAAASKIAALLRYYEIIKIRVDENKIIDCILRSSKGNEDLLAEVLFGMRRDFRDFYTWGQF